MKLVRTVLLLLLLFGFAVPSHATLMHVIDVKDATRDVRLDDVGYFNLNIGDLSPFHIGGASKEDLGKTLDLSSYLLDTILTEMLTRTHVLPADPNSYGDHDWMLEQNRFYSWVGIGDLSDLSEWQYGPHIDRIPDFSGYEISGYYLTQSWADDGITTSYHLQLLADAAPVPEPSTLLTVMTGFMES